MRKRRAGSVAVTFMLVFGAGIAGAVTPPGPPAGIIERPEAPTIFELLEAPVPGPTDSPEPPGEEDPDDGEDDQENDEGNGPSGHGKRVSDAAHDDRFSGCEKGMHVSEVASGGRAHPNGSPCDRGNGSDEDGNGPPPHAGGPPPWAGGPPPWAGGGGPPPGHGG